MKLVDSSRLALRAVTASALGASFEPVLLVLHSIARREIDGWPALAQDRLRLERRLAARAADSALGALSRDYGDESAYQVAQAYAYRGEADAAFDEAGLVEVVGVAVRMLDNVLDATHWPLERQQQEAANKRRVGLGYTGLGDALAMALSTREVDAKGMAGAWQRFGFDVEAGDVLFLWSAERSALLDAVRVEDRPRGRDAGGGRDLGVALPFQPLVELVLAIARPRDVRVRVDEPRHHDASRGIDQSRPAVTPAQVRRRVPRGAHEPRAGQMERGPSRGLDVRERRGEESLRDRLGDALGLRVLAVRV